jgi:hypothetical protein
MNKCRITSILIAIVVSSLFFLSGCIGEDYDAGPPVTKIGIENDFFTLKEANVDWQTQEKHYKNDVENVQEYGANQIENSVKPNEKGELIFEENKENGGDYTDETVNVSLWQGEKETKLEYGYNSRSFYFPQQKGKYVLEVEFSTRKGMAQYIGNIEIK